jgi:hypothetical protein
LSHRLRRNPGLTTTDDLRGLRHLTQNVSRTSERLVSSVAADLAAVITLVAAAG